MCILVHAVKRQSLELPLEERISNALVEVGPSITLASFSEILAFAVGSFIPMPACRVFSMFAGWKFFSYILMDFFWNTLTLIIYLFIFVALAVLLDFLLQVTAFVALIVFDFLRAEDNRIDCFPCIKLPSSSVEPNEGICAGLLSLYIYIYICSTYIKSSYSHFCYFVLALKESNQWIVGNNESKDGLLARYMKVSFWVL